MRPSVFLRVARPVFWALLVLPVFLAFYLSYQQYQLWLANPLTQLLLPPNQSVGYFISYASVTFFLPIAVNLLLASVALLIFGWLNRRTKGRIFEGAEPYLIGISILLSGANWMFFLVVVAGVALVGSVINLLLKRGQFSLYYFWLPAAVLVILISKIR
ncbi:MAG: hypothetical protein G01um101419_261 [Parcubacteria group bacterium Gr01-1014_19]|nr:MAG: hypothetical protein G01um101419_261 [Parcubacteria group bacterium Gr01-1014_19]